MAIDPRLMAVMTGATAPAPVTRAPYRPADPEPEPERELTVQEILGDRFIVVPVRATRRLEQAWGMSPAIDAYAAENEGVWWPSGVWTSRRRPEDDQTPLGCRQIVLRPARDVLVDTASYDTQEDGDRTWVLAMDAEGDPIGVWCLAHEAASKFLKAFTVPRWTPAAA